MNPKLTSICDICLTRNLDAENYENPVVESISQVMLYSFVGKKNNGQIKPDSLKHYLIDNNNRRQYESFIQDYDGNEVALQQISRREFNLAIIKSEDNEIDYTTINKRIENYLCKISKLKRPFNKNEQFVLKENSIIFPINYFCTYNPNITISIHHYSESSWVPDLKLYKVIPLLFFKLRIYSIRQGKFCKNIFNVKGIPFFTYPRFGQRSIILTIGLNKKQGER